MLYETIELKVVEHTDCLLTVVGRSAHPNHVRKKLLVDVHSWLCPLVAKFEKLPYFRDVVLLPVPMDNGRPCNMVKS